MKKYLLVFITCVILSVNARSQSFTWDEELTPTDTTVVFKDRFIPRLKATEPISVPLLPIKQRLSTKSPLIKVVGKNLPDYVMDCVEKAKSIWSSIIQDSLNCEIEIRFEPSSCDIQTEVKYKFFKNFFYPHAYLLAKGLTVAQIGKDGLEDIKAGTIIINSTEDWDIHTGDNIDVSKKNLTTGLIKAMCRIFGFGSPIVLNAPNDYRYPAGIRSHTSFDLLVQRSDGSLLKDIPCNPTRFNSKLIDFTTSSGSKFFVRDSIRSHQLADPPYSTNNPPFTALKEGLMSPYITIGDHMLQVDDATIDVLEMLGWTTQRKEFISIICTDSICETIVNPFKSHSFCLKSEHVPGGKAPLSPVPEDKVPLSLVTGGTWRLTLPYKDSDKSETIFYSDQNGSCTIPPFRNLDKYAYDINGITEARLDYCFELNGSTFRTYPYVLNIQRRPYFEKASVDSMKWLSSSRYEVYFSVKTIGAESVSVDCL